MRDKHFQKTKLQESANSVEASSLFQVHQDDDHHHIQEYVAECDATSKEEQGVGQVTTTSSSPLLPTKP
jgi:hypothetical protein